MRWLMIVPLSNRINYRSCHSIITMGLLFVNGHDRYFGVVVYLITNMSQTRMESCWFCNQHWIIANKFHVYDSLMMYLAPEVCSELHTYKDWDEFKLLFHHCLLKEKWRIAIIIWIIITLVSQYHCYLLLQIQTNPNH